MKCGVFFAVRTEFLNNIRTCFGFKGLRKESFNVILWSFASKFLKRPTFRFPLYVFKCLAQLIVLNLRILILVSYAYCMRRLFFRAYLVLEIMLQNSEPKIFSVYFWPSKYTQISVRGTGFEHSIILLMSGDYLCHLEESVSWKLHNLCEERT
jgi:hypothetical protein